MSWTVEATSFFLDAAGPVTQQRLNTFQDYLNSYKASGVNTITLTAFIPVDPATGSIEPDFVTPEKFGKHAVTAQYMAAFTDVAKMAGVQVIWKPQFISDDGSGQNVANWDTPANFNAQNFLSSVQKFWSQMVTDRPTTRSKHARTWYRAGRFCWAAIRRTMDANNSHCSIKFFGPINLCIGPILIVGGAKKPSRFLGEH